MSAHLFGDREIIRSQVESSVRLTKKFTEVHSIDESLKGQDVIVRGRLHNTRGKGSLAFLVIREQCFTI